MMRLMMDVPVFSAEESASMAQRLESLRQEWLVRGIGFYTFGVATYLDVMCSGDPEAKYYARLAAWNEKLTEHFAPELERVREVLSTTFQAPCRFEPAVALPGFHVFEEGAIATTERDGQHFDLQHRSLRWPFPRPGDDVLTFTLPVKLPRCGGALDVWDFLEEDLVRLERLGRQVSMAQLGRLKPVIRHEYHVGVMAVQLKPLMHRIAAVPERFEGDQRITLQGHGVRDGNTFVLYW